MLTLLLFVRGFPVCTGIDPEKKQFEYDKERFPRVYGDRPLSRIQFKRDLLVSPCVRG